MLDPANLPAQDHPEHLTGLAVAVENRDEAEALAARFGGDVVPVGHRTYFVVRLGPEGAAAYLREMDR